jgi:hypothetical protein
MLLFFTVAVKYSLNTQIREDVNSSRNDKHKFEMEKIENNKIMALCLNGKG